MSRPTVHDVARVAGVSLSTVDRVLNGREGVREVTVKRGKPGRIAVIADSMLVHDHAARGFPVSAAVGEVRNRYE